MAQDTIPAWYTQFYSANVRREAAQTKSRLEYLTEKITEKQAESGFYDSVGQVKSRKISVRFPQVEFTSVNHSRRKIMKEEFSIEIPIAERDLESILTDPKSTYISRAVEEMNRRKDRVILAAATADILTGQTGATTVTAATDGVLTVNATGGLVYGKIQEMNQNFYDNEVGVENNISKAFIGTGSDHTALMNINQFISGDFTRGQPVDEGKIAKVSGLDFIMFGASVDDPIIPVIGGQKQAVVIAQGGVALWTPRDISIEVEKRPDLVKTWQIVVTVVYGAVRTEGVYVQKLLTV